MTENSANIARVAGEVAGDFYEGRLDLTARGEMATTGWSTMPEVQITRELRHSGTSERSIRQFLTFVSTMDRARDAIRLWRAGGTLFHRHPEVFDPAVVSSMTSVRISGLLSAAGVSQRHGPDSNAWWTIGKSLAEGTGAICRTVARGAEMPWSCWRTCGAWIRGVVRGSRCSRDLRWGPCGSGSWRIPGRPE